MSWFIYVQDFVFCFFATAAFAFLLSAPKNVVGFSAFSASVGFFAYDIIYRNGISVYLACFVGTFIIALMGEIGARVFKKPAPLFIFPALIPLVPGIGLYQTMLYLVLKDYDNLSMKGTETLLVAGIMAAAIAVVNLVARAVFKKKTNQ